MFGKCDDEMINWCVADCFDLFGSFFLSKIRIREFGM